MTEDFQSTVNRGFERCFRMYPHPEGTADYAGALAVWVAGQVTV